MKELLLGVDIGTSNIKAVAFDTTGQQIAKVSTPTITHYPRPDWAYFEPDEIWAAIGGTLRRLMSNLPDDTEPRAIAFTSMGEAAVPIDSAGQPTHNIIAWFDRRTASLTEWWATEIGTEQTASITGLPVKTIFGILKLMWIRDNEPDVYARTHCWLNMADYGVFRLCGAKATDYSLASRMMVQDLSVKKWSHDLLDKAGVESNKLAELVPSGILLGHVREVAAAETGLPLGLPVCSGGHDHVCGALALGITDPGDVYDSMGTAESLFIATRKPILDPALTAAGIGQGIHVAPNRGYAMGGIYFSGGCIDWVRQLLLENVLLDDVTIDEKSTGHERLIELASQVEAGSGGAFFLPHLRQANPPYTDPNSRGAFVGLSSDMNGGHLARAVLEGVAYEFQLAYDSMMANFQLSPQRILASGGSTRNQLLMQIKADVSGQPITVPTVEEATCLGAALLSGIGAGVYTGFEDAAERVEFATRIIEPDQVKHQFYQERYHKVFASLYTTLQKVNWQISDWIQ